MSLANNLNFGGTVLTFGCVAFAASNFGVKLGRASGFVNRSGYEYISTSDKKEKLYADVVLVASKDKNAPGWAKDAKNLENWCTKNEKKLREWNNASKYCLIQNTVRHQLIKEGYKLEDQSNVAATSSTGTGGVAATGVTTENPKCEDVWNSYADSNGESVWYLYGKARCAKKEGEEAAAAPGS